MNLDRKDLSDRAADEMRKNYPDWKQNPYVQKESQSDLLPVSYTHLDVYKRQRLNYPGWENNAYLKRELFAKKLLGRLIQAKMWKTIQFLTKRKRTRN